MEVIYKLDLQHPLLLGCDFAAMWRMPECCALDRGVVTTWSEFVEGLRPYGVGLEGLRYLCSICTMHLASQGMCHMEGRQAWRGFVPLTRGGSRMVPLCRVFLMVQAGFGVTAKQTLAPLLKPWPAVPRGDGHTWTFCLCSLCLCPLKSPMLLQETAREFPEAEHAHLPGTATWNREQGSCKPALGHRHTQARPSLWLGHLPLKHLCCVGHGGLRRREQLPPPAQRGLTAPRPPQAVPWHQRLFPGGPRMWHSRLAPALSWEGKENG